MRISAGNMRSALHWRAPRELKQTSMVDHRGCGPGIDQCSIKPHTSTVKRYQPRTTGISRPTAGREPAARAERDGESNGIQQKRTLAAFLNRNIRRIFQHRWKRIMPLNRSPQGRTPATDTWGATPQRIGRVSPRTGREDDASGRGAEPIDRRRSAMCLPAFACCCSWSQDSSTVYRSRCAMQLERRLVPQKLRMLADLEILVGHQQPP